MCQDKPLWHIDPDAVRRVTAQRLGRPAVESAWSARRGICLVGPPWNLPGHLTYGDTGNLRGAELAAPPAVAGRRPSPGPPTIFTPDLIARPSS
jgi:hypothetical protein